MKGRFEKTIYGKKWISEKDLIIRTQRTIIIGCLFVIFILIYGR